MDGPVDEQVLGAHHQSHSRRRVRHDQSACQSRPTTLKRPLVSGEQRTPWGDVMRGGWPAVLFVGLLCGCGGSAALGSAATSSAVLPSTSPYPLSALAPFSQLFKDGPPIHFAKSKHGCTGPEGSPRTPHYYPCRDGAHLWRMESSTGA